MDTHIEWSKETVRRFWIENQRKELYDDEQWDTFFQSVADAHNATLRPQGALTDAQIVEGYSSQ